MSGVRVASSFFARQEPGTNIQLLIPSPVEATAPTRRGARSRRNLTCYYTFYFPFALDPSLAGLITANPIQKIGKCN